MCILRAFGDAFDVDAFVTHSTLPLHSVFHKGERRFPTSPRNQTCFTTCGLQITVSDREFADLSGQIEDAILFLHTHRDELARLTAFPGVEKVRLDFPRDLRIGTDRIWTQSDYLPPSLLRAAGNLDIGIVLSLYPPSPVATLESLDDDR